MSPWTSLLQSLHSAFLDELVERHPDPPPELGLPLRVRGFGLPEGRDLRLWVQEIEFAPAGDGGGGKSSRHPAQGLGLLALEAAALSPLGLVDGSALWESMLRRAGAEFLRRGIQPRFGKGVALDGNDGVATLPDSFAAPAAVVWIPVRLSAGGIDSRCFFGIGA